LSGSFVLPDSNTLGEVPKDLLYFFEGMEKSSVSISPTFIIAVHMPITVETAFPYSRDFHFARREVSRKNVSVNLIVCTGGKHVFRMRNRKRMRMNRKQSNPL
jgi:hypothetical protein